jgi:hypothetical protein
MCWMNFQDTLSSIQINLAFLDYEINFSID